MPAALSYPGVYIDEIPSGVRTITGVPTAICAFIGRTLTGPVDTPVILNSFADFERQHGGLNVNFPVSYAVRDFFNNGGAQAIMVRLYTTPGLTSPPTSDGIAKIAIPVLNSAPALTFQAVSPGSWGNNLIIRLEAADPSLATTLGFPAGTDVFDIVVKYPNAATTAERIRNVTLADTARKFDKVLANTSNLIRAFSIPDPNNPLSKLINYTTSGGSPVGPIEYGVTNLQGADSVPLTARADFIGSAANRTGLNALEKTDIFNLLCIPPDTRGGDLPANVISDAVTYCAGRRAIMIIDAPTAWNSVSTVNLSTLGVSGVAARNAAVYFPRVLQADSLKAGQIDTFVPCGAIAGEIASTDARRGVFKAPAGIDAGLNGVRGLSVGNGAPFTLTDADNGALNPIGVNCLRVFPVIGPVIWGARTLRGADQLADDYKYLPVRRLVLFIEESLYRGTKFAVFEPNDEPLWAQLRLNVGAFMQNLFRQGAFQGQSQTAAYFVKCDKETTTQNDINLGVVNIVVGFAPLKPAEFVVIKIQQIAGPIAV